MPVPSAGAALADPPAHGPRRHLAEAPTWIFETHRVSAAAPTAFDAAPAVHWRSLDRAYDRPLRRLWRSLLRLLGFEQS